MCKINCNGGCIDCAPEEHAASTYASANAEDICARQWDLIRPNQLSRLLETAFLAGVYWQIKNGAHK